MGMIRRRRQLFREDGSLLRKLLRRNGAPDEAWSQYQERVFDCTLCGRCEVYCPVGIKIRDLIIAMRQELATARTRCSRQAFRLRTWPRLCSDWATVIRSEPPRLQRFPRVL
jgi:Fe-S oxidoreductase